MTRSRVAFTSMLMGSPLDWVRNLWKNGSGIWTFDAAILRKRFAEAESDLGFLPAGFPCMASCNQKTSRRAYL